MANEITKEQLIQVPGLRLNSRKARFIQTIPLAGDTRRMPSPKGGFGCLIDGSGDWYGLSDTKFNSNVMGYAFATLASDYYNQFNQLQQAKLKCRFQ